MEQDLMKLKRKLYKQLAKGKMKKASKTRKAMVELECKLNRKGFQFDSRHIVT